ncbi:MAG: hypothetical protein K9N06_09260 [Candidatus Cloacimonetes bacterium]|nr:hypothetical protein [Candidatus Cloacimonadota bacterium]
MKRIYVTLIIMILSITFIYGDNEQSEATSARKEKLRESVDLRLKSGVFLPADKAIEKLYGNGFAGGIDIIVWGRSSFGLGLSIQEYRAFADSPTEEIRESSISILPVILSLLFEDRNLSFGLTPYYGMGMGFITVDEKFKRNGNNCSASDVKIGYATTFGIRAEHVFLEMKYTQARIHMDGVLGREHDFNAGGLSICGGFKF